MLDKVGAAAAQKTKEKPAVHATAPPKTSRTSGKAKPAKLAAKELTEKEKTAEDDLRALDALHRMTETNEVDVSSAPLELMGKCISNTV